MRIINQQVNACLTVTATRPWIRLILRHQVEVFIMKQKQKRVGDKRVVNVWFTVIAFGLSCFLHSDRKRLDHYSQFLRCIKESTALSKLEQKLRKKGSKSPKQM